MGGHSDGRGIARLTGHDRKTVRGVLARPLIPAAPPARPRRGSKLDPFAPYLEGRLAEGVYNARKLYHEIQARGYTGKETQVRAFVQPHRAAHRAAARATVRFETAPGEQAQVDWGHFGYIDHHGRQRRLYAFVMTLGWSRAMYLEFTVSAESAWFLRCHLHAFHYFGGVPRQVLHDNLKTAVVARGAGGVVHWHPPYLDFAHYYGFAPRACQPYRAQTKGKVESGVRYVRGNFWLGLTYVDLADLNRQARAWLDTVANLRTHGTTGVPPFARLPDEGLTPLVGKPDYDTSLVAYRWSSADCLVSYEGNLYSVPAAYARQRLLVRETEREEVLIVGPDGAELARHRLAHGVGERVVVPAHYQPLAAGRPAGPARRGGAQQRAAPAAHLPDAPAVEARPLAEYDRLAGVTR
ncbi:MAG TPA: IS21 family transposase [Thermomicrobiales bacterium]|nr:IS21 family transposase [Thermomicrobiales bacterium]